MAQNRERENFVTRAVPTGGVRPSGLDASAWSHLARAVGGRSSRPPSASVQPNWQCYVGAGVLESFQRTLSVCVGRSQGAARSKLLVKVSQVLVSVWEQLGNLSLGALACYDKPPGG